MEIKVSYQSVIGAVLREERLKRGLTLDKGSRLIGVVASTLHQIENGSRSTVDKAVEMCSVYGFRLSDLALIVEERMGIFKNAGVKVFNTESMGDEPLGSFEWIHGKKLTKLSEKHMPPVKGIKWELGLYQYSEMVDTKQ